MFRKIKIFKPAKQTVQVHRLRQVPTILIAVLFAISLFLLASPLISSYLTGQNQRAALTSLNRRQIKANEHKKGQFDFDKVHDLNAISSVKARLHNTANAIGALAIPAVKLYLPILKGLSDTALSTGAGTMRADQKMGQGNYPLAGHYMTRYGNLFSPIARLKPNDRVYLTNLAHVYVYRVHTVTKVPPTAVYLVANTPQKIVTLITCADGGKNRTAVRAKLIKKVKANRCNLKVFKLK